MPEPFLESVEPYGDDKLAVRCLVQTFDLQAMLVAAAEDAEFTVNRRIFLTPVVSEVVLTVGRGNWYVRVGAVQGTPNRGIVEWSGIHGPVAVSSGSEEGRDHVGDPGLLPILHSKPVDNGFRIFTNKTDPHYVFFEIGQTEDVGTRFPVGKTKWKWMLEKGHTGWIDCWGMQYPNTYSVRLLSFDGRSFPADKVVPVKHVRTFTNITCARTPFYRSFEDLQNDRRDQVILLERKTNPNMKFASHADYLKFQAAVVRSGDDKARTVGPRHYSAAEHAAADGDTAFRR